MIRWLAYLCMAVAIALMVIGQLAIRIANPDMSETRLFIAYWWYWLICVAFAFGGTALARWSERHD